MRVRLVAVTEPIVCIEGKRLTAEELVVYCARVSSPQNQANLDTAPKLLRYLIKHAHWSPFETVSATLEIETSRAISAQILRHRSFTFQEFSARYADPTTMGFEPVTPRRQDQKNRQNSTDDLDETTAHIFQQDLEYVQNLAKSAYKWAIESGVAKESARMLLPMNVRTRVYMTGSLRSWLHYFDVRCGPETQFEHRQVALEARSIIYGVFPNVAAALEEVGQ